MNTIKTEGLSPAGKLLLFGFGALSLLGGWLLIYYSNLTNHADNGRMIVFVDSPPTTIMAFIHFLGATVAFIAILKPWLNQSSSTALALAISFVPPALYFM